jgi:hypothetical protein
VRLGWKVHAYVNFAARSSDRLADAPGGTHTGPSWWLTVSAFFTTSVSPMPNTISGGMEGGASPLATRSAVPAGMTSSICCGTWSLLSLRMKNETSLRPHASRRPAASESAMRQPSVLKDESFTGRRTI